MKIFFNDFLRFLLCLALLSGNFSVLPQSSLNPNDEPARLEIEAQALGLEWRRESIKKAIEIYLKAAEKWIDQNSLQKSAESLRKAAQLHKILGDKDKSEQLLTSALNSVKDKRHLETESRIYSDLSVLALEKGQPDESRAFFEKALSLAAESNDVPAQAMAFFSAGEFYYFRNEIQNSLDSYKKSIDLWRQAQNLQGEAKSLLSLSYLYFKQSDYDLGLETLNAALSKYKEAKDVRGEVLSLMAIGFAANIMNEKQKALENLHRAERLFPEDLDYAEKASLYNSIGHVYEEYEEWQISLNYREKAFDLFKRENHLYGQLATLPSLGQMSHSIGDNSSAAKYFEQSEALAKQLKNDFFLAITKTLSGDFYFLSGDVQKAQVNYEESLKLFKEGMYQKYVARSLNKLGQILAKQNQAETARKNFLTSLELNRKVRDKFGEADTLYQLAKLDLFEGKESEALERIKNSIEITENLYTDVLNSKLKSTYFSSVYDRYELYVGLLMKMHERAPSRGFDVQALQASEKSRSRSMLETLRLTEADFTKDADPEIVRREKETRSLLNAKADSLTDLLSRHSDPAEIQKVSSDINELSNELEQIKANLKQNSPIYSAIQNPAPFDLGEFQNQILDENTMLLEFSLGRDASYLWVTEKNNFSSFVLPPRERLETAVQKLRELLDSREMLENETVADYQARLADADKHYRQEARRLSSELFGQIADRLKEKRLVVVPDGKLHYFPLGALPFPHAETDDPLLLTNEIISEPSASTLLILSKNGNQTPTAEKELLVFADPVFSVDDSRLASAKKEEAGGSATVNNFRFAESLNSLPRLPASKDESETIMDIIGASKSDVFSGFSANRERLLNFDLSKYKIIHFATHGLIDEQRPELSGIVLSRFAENGQKLDEFVRLNDIYGMNLSANLVVLSACSTGIGKEVRGEGLQSLNNAFLQVGAKSVMSSLWKVDDYATLELMKNFYTSMAEENLTPSQALRKAKIKMRQNPRFNSPFYWAAFTIQGDFRRAPDLAGGWDYKFYFLILLLPVLLLGIWMWLKRRNLEFKL